MCINNFSWQEVDDSDCIFLRMYMNQTNEIPSVMKESNQTQFFYPARVKNFSHTWKNEGTNIFPFLLQELDKKQRCGVVPGHPYFHRPRIQRKRWSSNQTWRHDKKKKKRWGNKAGPKLPSFPLVQEIPCIVTWEMSSCSEAYSRTDSPSVVPTCFALRSKASGLEGNRFWNQWPTFQLNHAQKDPTQRNETCWVALRVGVKGVCGACIWPTPPFRSFPQLPWTHTAHTRTTQSKKFTTSNNNKERTGNRNCFMASETRSVGVWKGIFSVFESHSWESNRWRELEEELDNSDNEGSGSGSDMRRRERESFAPSPRQHTDTKQVNWIKLNQRLRLSEDSVVLWQRNPQSEYEKWK